MQLLKNRLIRYLDAGFPILYVNTFEEEKMDRLLRSLHYKEEMYEWNESQGYIDFYTGTPIVEDCSFEMMLDLNKSVDLLDGKMLVLKDVTPYLEDARIAAKIKGLARQIHAGADAAILIVSESIVIPRKLEKYITILEMDYLSVEEIAEVIEEFIASSGIPPVSRDFLDEMAMAFKGLTEFEICNLIALAYASSGKLTRKDLKLIFEQKQQMIRKAGILEMVDVKETIEDIGGLDNLKEWLIRKARVFKNMNKARRFGVDVPKGVLVAGMPGCGKSLSAKVASGLFEVPLLRLDMGRIMGKYVGESECNLRKAIALAEAISPCILWIDELEKAFAGVGGDGGGAEVMTRLFGNFLTWMQEKTSATFVVATANNITKLPPELLRKGRFDELFYVGLPDEKERAGIFDIHIRKRRPADLKNIDIGKLVNLTKGYSGADIEGVVKDAVETVFTDEKDFVTTNDIVRAIENTHSLSELMKDSVENMQKEYKERKFKNASK